MRRLLVVLTAAAAIGWVGSAIAYSDEGFTVIDCTISGDEIPGTKILIPNSSGDWVVEIDRDGRTLVSTGKATGYAFARDGEPYRGYHVGVLVLSGTGNGYDCDAETTTTQSDDDGSTTTLDETTTTGGDVTSTTEPEASTTTVPDVTTTLPDTTTTQPNTPDDDGCPAGTTADATGFCFADSEGG